MAAAPQWKVYRGGEYVAACKYAEDAAAMVSVAGGLVKHGHSLIVWREGQEQFSAGDSYDGAAKIMEQRRYESYAAAYVKMHGKLPA
jgi:endonuclease YncB( thermonuclease family)